MGSQQREGPRLQGMVCWKGLQPGSTFEQHDAWSVIWYHGST